MRNASLSSSFAQRCGALILLLAVAGQAAAKVDPSIAGEFSVHPRAIGQDGNFFILVEQPASDHCTTDVQMQISPEAIDLWVAPLADGACTSSGQPARRTLLSPRDGVGKDYPFAQTVQLRYRLVSDNEVIELDAQEIRIGVGAGASPPERVDSGSWINAELPFASLVVDQQDQIISLSLLDYDHVGRPIWLYASGELDGNTFSGELYRYRESVCRLKNCKRASGEEKGRIQMVMVEGNDLVVNLDTASHLSSRIEAHRAYSYARIDLTRSPEAARIDASGARIPDLVGTWVAGTAGAGNHSARTSAFEAMTVEYMGPANLHNREHIFLAFPGAERLKLGDGVFPTAAVRYAVSCLDERPEREQTVCQLMPMSESGSGCIASFPLQAVGVDRISAEATCNDEVGSYATRFEMFRLDIAPVASAVSAASTDALADDPADDGVETSLSAAAERDAAACHQRRNRWNSEAGGIGACD